LFGLNGQVVSEQVQKCFSIGFPSIKVQVKPNVATSIQNFTGLHSGHLFAFGMQVGQIWS
jgi:hypothetical protein